MPKEALFLYKSFNKFAFLFTETVRNVVIDADPGVDDTIALMMAFEAQIRGEINILAITISFGNAPVKNGLKNLAAIMYFYPQFLKVRNDYRINCPSQKCVIPKENRHNIAFSFGITFFWEGQLIEI